jgi:hypothetical protein
VTSGTVTDTAWMSCRCSDETPRDAPVGDGSHSSASRDASEAPAATTEAVGGRVRLSTSCKDDGSKTTTRLARRASRRDHGPYQPPMSTIVPPRPQISSSRRISGSTRQ